ncbi:hypothetical protein NPIL_688671 [Nephila pilipes]|uniref:Uncharacterized protein n=1 Tax=Nephila pilipes TaxID=299642 RepID=A0A8X6PUC3_NEPPI|nr:hypothetical protein NPIL_688671 [Nephila pilipes]
MSSIHHEMNLTIYWKCLGSHTDSQIIDGMELEGWTSFSLDVITDVHRRIKISCLRTSRKRVMSMECSFEPFGYCLENMAQCIVLLKDDIGSGMLKT